MTIYVIQHEDGTLCENSVVFFENKDEAEVVAQNKNIIRKRRCQRTDHIVKKYAEANAQNNQIR